MSEDDNATVIATRPVADSARFWGEHRLSVLLIGSVVISIVLTVVSVYIYNNSGAAQLDLSRPGYLSVSDKVEDSDPIDSYSASGEVNQETVNEFIKLYETEAAKAQELDAFKGDPLNPEVLEFGATTAAE